MDLCPFTVRKECGAFWGVILPVSTSGAHAVVVGRGGATEVHHIFHLCSCEALWPSRDCTTNLFITSFSYSVFPPVSQRGTFMLFRQYLPARSLQFLRQRFLLFQRRLTLLPPASPLYRLHYPLRVSRPRHTASVKDGGMGCGALFLPRLFWSVCSAGCHFSLLR
jgi:hypothetical protein